MVARKSAQAAVVGAGNEAEGSCKTVVAAGVVSSEGRSSLAKVERDVAGWMRSCVRQGGRHVSQ